MGTIPTEIAMLEKLSRVDFGNNQIGGTIPTELGEWQNLLYFGIDGNLISGTIPTEIGKLTQMEYLFLANNSITGSIPTEIGAMNSLQGLFLNLNLVFGTIPTEIEGVPSLKYFITSYNLMTGTMPTELGSFVNLTYIGTSNNRMEGTIPSEFGRLTKLSHFQIGNNTFEGSLPAGLLNNSYFEDGLDIYGNEFSGLISIDGLEVCSVGGGEVYCDCSRNCLFEPKLCDCEAGQSCCDSYTASRPPCLVCPSRKAKDPDFLVEAYEITCQEALDLVAYNIHDWGSEDQCELVTKVYNSAGCRCDEDTDDALFEDSVIGDSVDV